MARVAPGRRELVVGAAGTALGALGLAAAPPASAAGIDTRSQLAAALDAYMATRAGVAGLTFRDNRTAQYFTWRPPSGRQTHSAIKVLILIATLKAAQNRDRDLTATERSLCSRMIRYSDNAATDALMNQVGVTLCRSVARELGMRNTTVLGGTVFASPTWWGHSVSTPRDLVYMFNPLALGSYLTPSRRAYAHLLLGSVTPGQTWGLRDGLPSDVHVELKNGWGPRSDGYRLNGVGQVYGRGRNYQMAFMSVSHAGYAYGQTTVNRLCRIVFDALDKPLP